MKTTPSFCVIALCSILLLFSCSKDASAPADNGKSGSVTKFATVNNYLYILNNNKLDVYDVSDELHTSKVGSITVAYTTETIFSFNNKLYIGATDGIYVVDITDPVHPVLKARSEYLTFRCDPVIARDSVAYSTTKTGRGCNGNSQPANTLQVIDIRNENDLNTVNVLSLNEPNGLAFDGNTLFVCDGSYGLRVYDITQAYYPVEIERVTSINAVDVIADNNLLIVSSPAGYSFFDYSDISNIHLVKTIDKN